MVVVFDEKFPQEIQQDLMNAIVFFSDYLISRKLDKHITIHMEMKKTFADHGDCEVLDYNTQHKARVFKIRLRNKKSLKSIIKTLAHEMVHVKQFAKGELSEYHDRWQGIDHSETPYHDLPWEIEARTLEHIMFDLFKNKHPNTFLPKQPQ